MIIYVDFIIKESKPFIFMKLKGSDFSIGRGQQIDDSFYHFGSKRKLDPVGSTVRYEMMKLCTGSV